VGRRRRALVGLLLTVAAAGCGSQSSQLDARALAVARRYAEAFYVAHDCEAAAALAAGGAVDPDCESVGRAARTARVEAGRVTRARLAHGCGRGAFGALVGADAGKLPSECVRAHVTWSDCGAAINGKPAVSRNVSTLEIFLKRGGDSWRVFAVGTVEGSSAGTSILCRR